MSLPLRSFDHSSGAQLRVDGLSASFGDRRVLTDVSFVISPGDRVGVIGENGSGKSTLLRAIAGAVRLSAGSVSVSMPGGTDAKIGLLHQEPPFAPGDGVGEAIESAVATARQAVVAVGELAAAMAATPDDESVHHSYDRALDTADRLDAWAVDSRISATLAGLGLADVPLARPTGQLSGGQRARLALAWLLLSAPDVLLLDEPTNHLDDAATAYLTAVLGSWRGPVLMASHDRAFLDEAATVLIDLDPVPLPHAITEPLVEDGAGTGIGTTRFTGGYTDYLAIRARSRLRWEQQFRDEQAELRRLRAAVTEQQVVGHAGRPPRTEARASKKFYSDRNATVVSRRVNDARARLDDLARRQVRKPPAELKFRWPATSGTARSGPTLVAAGAAVEGRLSPVSVAVGHGEQWLVTGPNGSGKSTLLDLLTGRLAPTSGTVTRQPSITVGLLTQDTDLADPFDRGPGRSVLRAYTDLVGRDRAEQVPLGTFGLIAARDRNRPVATLSVGQQRRLALAVLLADPPDVLLLDEPTNHFSLRLVDALEQALAGFSGTVIIASHDRWLRRRWTGQLLSLTAAT